PILGTKFVSYLKYIRYTLTEYLFDHADNLINDRKAQFKTFGEYGRKYRKMEEEKRKKEQQKRQEAQQKEWEERFRQWAEYQNSQRNRSYGGYSWGGQNYGYGNQAYTNPSIDFKNKYEKSCDILGVDYDSDKYQIKLAYRKKAKEYHPDINKASDATQRFQQINNAYEFLSDANIERYKNLA
ncbi:MAG TPA: DnaJ domain-containing protein, partial [Clostridia bacterium]|nr:DnaJ domain-containing protein [Clostridia bacterium]